MGFLGLFFMADLILELILSVNIIASSNDLTYKGGSVNIVFRTKIIDIKATTGPARLIIL